MFSKKLVIYVFLVFAVQTELQANRLRTMVKPSGYALTSALCIVATGLLAKSAYITPKSRFQDYQRLMFYGIAIGSTSYTAYRMAKKARQSYRASLESNTKNQKIESKK